MNNSSREKEMKRAFDLVKNPIDWKAPIHAVIEEDERYTVSSAIIFYTATVPVFEDIGEGKLQVIADGYRNGPAGDY